jgi:uroporphyrin-III C-methyltransferase
MERVTRRMRWVNQISEYWPVERLAAMKEDEMRTMLELKTNGKETGVQDVAMTRSAPSVAPSKVEVHALASKPVNDGPSGGRATHSTHISSMSSCIPDKQQTFNPSPLKLQNTSAYDESRHSISLNTSLSSTPPRGQVLLVGSGPGHPSMLTVAARKALTELATHVLSDKLVPAEILALIPPHVPLTIAKKYPGNAERAQAELMQEALEGAGRGEIVVRVSNCFLTSCIHGALV